MEKSVSIALGCNYVSVLHSVAWGAARIRLDWFHLVTTTAHFVIPLFVIRQKRTANTMRQRTHGIVAVSAWTSVSRGPFLQHCYIRFRNHLRLATYAIKAFSSSSLSSLGVIPPVLIAAEGCFRSASSFCESNLFPTPTNFGPAALPIPLSP
jgi:hypothetical protein